MIETKLRRTPLPVRSGKIIAVAPLEEARSIWLVLSEDGRLSWLDADTLELEEIAAFMPSATAAVWQERSFDRRLHVSARGDLAAVVNDRGRYGQVFDLRSGRVTMELDGGEYHQDTVAFSFAFAETQGRPLAIHRTGWNRL